MCFLIVFKMVRILDFVKVRVLFLLKRGKIIVGIVREFKEVDGVSINRKIVVKFLRYLKINISIVDKVRFGRLSKFF